jgi:hypothetical protein
MSDRDEQKPAGAKDAAWEAALASHMGIEAAAEALWSMDELIRKRAAIRGPYARSW